MAEEYITKTKKVKGETVSTTYRVDADYVPTKISDICQEFIENYCVAHKATDWLVKEVSIPYERKLKDGTTAPSAYPFISLRTDFAKEFFPAIVGNSSKPAESFSERIKRLYGKK